MEVSVHSKRVGLFGLGAFGRLIVRHLSPYFEIHACDPSPEAARFVKRHNVILGSAADVASQPYVILATPIRTLEPLLKTIAPHIQPGACVFDVGSVKIKPAGWLSQYVPVHAEIVCTHPLFGPQSAQRGLHGLEIVVCPIRVRHVAPIIRFLETALDLKVTLTTPEAHDEALAAVQGLTHLIAKVMSGLEPLPRAHMTRSYALMMEGIGLVSGDSDELFLSIERDNPFAVEVRKRFFTEIENLRLMLDSHRNGG